MRAQITTSLVALVPEEVRHAYTNHYKFSSIGGHVITSRPIHCTCSDSCTHVGHPCMTGNKVTASLLQTIADGATMLNMQCWLVMLVLINIIKGSL